MSNKNNPFNLVDYSPWAILGAFSAMTVMMGLIKWFHMYNNNLLLLGFSIMILIMYQWWRDIFREGTFQGLHTFKVTLGLRWGMFYLLLQKFSFLFLFFEVFFISFSLAPAVEMGMHWPPLGIKSFNPIQIPLLNTLILLTSGLTVTWTHLSLMESNYSQALQGLLFTVILGFYFTMLQAYEYLEAPFTISDAVYGSSFFMATGFHGIHVIIGTTFLLVCLIRHYFNHYSNIHHFGFEAAAWYWHFVDVVWLFLYISIYWWGS